MPSLRRCSILLPPSLGPLLLFCALLAGCQRFQSAESLLKEGDLLAERKEYAEAVLRYQKAIQKDPQLNEAFFRLGLAQGKLGKNTEAFNAFRVAAARMPQRLDVQAELGDLGLRAYLDDSARPQALYKLLQDTAEAALKQDANFFPALRWKGYLAVVDQKPGEAAEWFRKARQAKPDQPDVTEALARSLFLQKQPEEAVALLTELTTKAPAFAPAYDLLYAYHAAAQRWPEAVAVLEKKIAQNPKQGLYVIQLSQHHWGRNQRPEAEKWLAQLVSNPAAYPDGRLLAGDFRVQTGDGPAAMALYQQGITADAPRKLDYQKRLVSLYLAQRQGTEAAKLLEEILKEHPEDAEMRASRAMLRLESGIASELTQAVAALEALVKDKPEDVRFRYELGLAQRMSGDLPGAQVNYQEVLKRNPVHFLALEGLAEIALELGQSSAALPFADRILAARPQDPRGRVLKARVLLAQQNFGEARPLLTRLMAEYPQTIDVRLAMINLDIAQKRLPAAEQTLQPMLQAKLDNPRVWQAYTQLRLAQDRAGEVVKTLQAELAKTPQPELRRLLAIAAATDQQYDLAIAQYQELAKLAPTAAEYPFQLGLLYQLKGDFSRAAEVLQQAEKLAPKNARAVAELAAALDQAGRKPEAEAAFRGSLALQPDNLLVLNNLAYFLAQNGGSLEEALRFARQATQKAPEVPEFAGTLATIYLRQKNFDGAAQVYGSLVAKYPGRPSFHLGYGTALLEKGDKARAVAQLELALKAKPAPAEQPKIESLLATARRR